MRRSRSGLTLAETLVSLTLLSLLMVAVLNLFPSSMTIVKMTRTGWLARATAQDRVEALAARPFTELVIGYDHQEDVTLSDGATTHLRTTVTAVDGHLPRLLKRVRCEATWDGRATRKSAVQEFYVNSVRR